MEDQLDRRTKRTRHAIKSAFIKLILEKGYDSTTILDIANQADYNRGTFYNHFVGKEELLKAIHDEFLQGLAEALLEPYEGMKRVEATNIFPSTLQLFEHIEKNKEEFMALLSVDKGIALEIYDLLRESMRKDMHIEMESSDPPIDYEIMLSYRMSATVGVIMYWAETNFKYSAGYMAEQLLMQVNTRMDYIEFKR
ncbi:TetR/AcrR family transcriptional regulator [Paenibacillus sp. UNC451MF]|uniref:TetR/AcrR family transcriptional regulator n=1 Tax=Paenibacillus sp. UNC451MF TaxID=1449063 RepID=UPI00048E88B1|nr:TetR/AcrR family transcriptional regulator [Paenibacillus sp. UNC451MF]